MKLKARVRITVNGHAQKTGVSAMNIELDGKRALLLASLVVLVDEGASMVISSWSESDLGAARSLISSPLPSSRGESRSRAHEPDRRRRAFEVARRGRGRKGRSSQSHLSEEVRSLTQTEFGRPTHIDGYAEKLGFDYVTAREEFIADNMPLGRQGEFAGFRRAVAYVSSPAASYMISHSLNVDGGWANAPF